MARVGAVNRLWLLAACMLFVVGPGAAKDNVGRLNLFDRPKHTVGQPFFTSSGCVGAELHATPIWIGGVPTMQEGHYSLKWWAAGCSACGRDNSLCAPCPCERTDCGAWSRAATIATAPDVSVAFHATSHHCAV